ncbi:hypothetical protein B9Z55_015547 [Caenorhabditis nigoni]|uniref:Uncharacterized protein n=1 Tax=Caenorhabditis nigoni TaxID=1611254 RepID=A0A2G5UAP6_9PELO|nr:hypothetical protein B9Z55_015547 [Caenorhabditis nigoni]
MTEEEKKEVEEYEALTLKRLIEIHTEQSPYAYEENYNRQLRESKMEKLRSAIGFSKEILEKKIANTILISWQKTYDRTDCQYFNDRMRRDLDQEIRDQIRDSVKKGYEKGMEMVSNYEKDKIIKEADEKERVDKGRVKNSS